MRLLPGWLLKIKHRLARPAGLALALFIALVVVCLGQIIWWIYFQVTISKEQIDYYHQQTQSSARIAAFILNRNYDRLRLEAESFVSVDNVNHLRAALDLLLSDPAVIGYRLQPYDGSPPIVEGETDSSFYLVVGSRNRAVLYLDPLYPARLGSELSVDLEFTTHPRLGAHQSPWFDESMFSVRKDVSAQVEEKANRRVVMFAMEGSFFVLLTLLGAFMIYRTLRQSESLKHQQENFIHAITHELKIPVASIKLYLESMASGKFDPEKLKGFVPRMLDDCARLEGLVDNVLEAGRLSQRGHHANLVETDLSGDLREYVDGLRPLLERHKMKVSLELDPELPVKTDYHALRRVVTALVDNAIKYSPEDRRELTITARRENSNVVLRFADRGQGVERHELKKVFERFYRSSMENTRSVKGTGIGLFLVKQIVTEHGGSVVLESEGADKGSTFVIRLPLAR